MMRISSYYGCLAAAITMAVNSKVLQLEWSTDDTVNYSKGRQLIGPDGPWQAVRFDVGAQYVLGWPTFSRWSAVIANDLTRPIRIDNTTTQLGRGGVLDPFGISGSIRNQTCWGDQYILKTGLYPKGKEYATGIQINAITTILDPCSINLPDGRTYDNTVGNLGLGFDTDLDDNFVPDPAAVLVQLKNFNITVSNSFGFHIGSAALNQSGSMVLGGYEMNRVLGPVGSLNFYRFYLFVIFEDSRGEVN
ncbi:hypothetical protein NUW58_g5811 [Xylaria curta]|uniref:Uncharacterized protein n=1 Tax=Xylaria curta TaxID=42375 RepID=A0ACC1P106_9PEZI|nr:hypothetical protein NUW58_g5811 [Xylaria curta]